MSDENKKTEEEKLEEEYSYKDNYVSESFLSKFVRSGLLAYGSSILMRGTGTKTKIAKAAFVAGVSLYASEDKDRAKDAAAVASVFAIPSSIKYASEFLKSNPNTLKKAYTYAQKADDVIKDLGIITLNLTQKRKEVFAENVLLNQATLAAKNENAGSFKSTMNNIYYGTLLPAFQTIKRGVSFSIENTYHVDKYKKAILDNSYYANAMSRYAGIDIKDLELKEDKILKELGVDFADDRAYTLKDRFFEKIESVGNFISPGFKFDFLNKKREIQKELDKIKYIKKMQRIEESSFFTDSLGMFSKLENGKIVADIERIVDRDANFAVPLQKLATDFEDKMKKLRGDGYTDLSPEEQEKMFLTYLKDKGLGEVIDNFYKKDNHITFGDIEEYYHNIKDNKDAQKYFLTAKRHQMSFLKIPKEMKNGEGIEVANINILRNFSFTNVVEKTSDGVIDTTTLDGTLLALRSIGAIEKNIPASFKIPLLEHHYNLWNPFKLVDSNNRMKTYIANNTLGFAYNSDGLLLNKKRFAEIKFEGITSISRLGKAAGLDGKMYNDSIYRLTDDDAIISYNRNILELIGDSINISKEYKRDYDITMSDILVEFKQNGLKSAFEKFSNSLYNPFTFRYKKGNGFTYVSEKDSYMKDKSFWGRIFNRNKKDVDYKELKSVNDYIKKVINLETANISVTNKRFSSSRLQQIIAKRIEEIQLVDDVDLNKQLKQELEYVLLNSEMLTKNLIHNNYGKNAVKYSDFEFGLNAILSEFKKTKGIDMNENELEKLMPELVIKNVMFSNTSGKYSSNKFFNFVNYISDAVQKDDSDIFKKYNQSIREIYETLYTDTSASNFPRNLIFNPKDKSTAEFVSFLKDVSDIESRAKANVVEKIHKDGATYINYIDLYLRRSDLSSSENVFNPLYEMELAYEYNKMFKKYSGENVPENIRNIVLGMQEEINSVFGNKKETYKIGEIKPYKFFDNIMDTITNAEGYGERHANEADFVKAIKSFKEIKYTNPFPEDDYSVNNASALLARNKFIQDNMRDTLKNIGRTILGIFSDDSKSIEVTIEGQRKEIKKLKNNFAVLSRTAIKNLQDSLEYLGIERVPSAKLGNHGGSQFYNFMKYRFMPLLTLTGGIIAADSLSDAIIPDDVPLIGNGISGIAATGVAAARVGAQFAFKFTGMLALMRGLENTFPGLIDNAIGNSLDLLMSPSEMIDVYFRGKPIEVKDNRWWFTAGRQSASGEEFKQYRPHLFYIWQHKDAGVYSNKFEKFFRQDFALTKYPWYILDPYKEEREAYEKYGALYPKTEQLFAEIPVIGGFLNATIGEIIKPTQYINEEEWRVGDNLMRNPNYNPDDPSSPEFIEFNEPNKFVKAFFEAFEDLKTFAGLPGFAVTKFTEQIFGTDNPYKNQVGLSSIDEDIGPYARYDRLQLGDLFGLTEPIRRLIDDPNGLDMIKMNPLEQNLPDFLPDYFRKGNNPYLTWDFGSYILPGVDFDRTENHTGKEMLDQFRILSLTAPQSSNFKQLQSTIMESLSTLSTDERDSYYESLSYASEYGERDYRQSLKKQKAKDIREINLTIDKKISPYEFISDGKRYKLDTVVDDYNELSKRYGSSGARKKIDKLNNTFQEGQTYKFKISGDATYSVGIDEQGDYFKVDSNLISNDLNLHDSPYRGFGPFNTISRIVNTIAMRGAYNPMDIATEKIFGNKGVVQEWAHETVQAPYFRDWDNPVQSFIEPFFGFSSNNIFSSLKFNEKSQYMYMNSDASINVLGLLSKAGAVLSPINQITGNRIVSSQYEEETEAHDTLETIKYLNGEKSYYNMTGKESLGELSNMVNEQDGKFLKDLLNVNNAADRREILRNANSRLKNVLETVWNRQQDMVSGERKYIVEREAPNLNNVPVISPYSGIDEETIIKIKSHLNMRLSKLDHKRLGVYNSYRGTAARKEGEFISNRLYNMYGTKGSIVSTIHNKGVININMEDRRN